MSTFWIPSQQVLANDLNRMFQEGSFDFIYDGSGLLIQADDLLTLTTYTFNYYDSGLLSDYTDGITTWTYTYNDDGLVTNVTTS